MLLQVRTSTGLAYLMTNLQFCRVSGYGKHLNSYNFWELGTVEAVSPMANCKLGVEPRERRSLRGPKFKIFNNLRLSLIIINPFFFF